MEELEIIQCPNCKEADLLYDFFNWDIDLDGHPTIENMTCKSCLCSNVSTEWEEDGQLVENIIFELDDFKFIDFKELDKEAKARIQKRNIEITTPSTNKNADIGDYLPF